MAKTLKPQDVLVGLKLIAIGEERWFLAHMARSLRISIGATHNAVTHLRAAGLVREKEGAVVVVATRMLDFLVHGAPAMLYPVKGGITRGIPTAGGGPPLAGKFARAGDIPVVWPVPSGRVKGEGLEPIYDTAPLAAAEDAKLYDLLTLVDAIRVGRPRELAAAIKELAERVTGGRPPGQASKRADETTNEALEEA